MVAADLRYNWTETVLRRGVSGEVPQDRISKKRDQYGGLTYEGDFAPFGIELGGGVADSNNEYRHSEDPDYNGDLESDVYDGFLHLNWDAAPWLGLFGGASYNREDVDSPQRDFVETREVIALFLETRLTLFDRLSVQLSGRMEDYSDFGVNFAPKISGRCEVASWLALRASVSRSYQVPTLYQLHDRFIGAMGWNDIYGNPDLEPAEGINYNLGVVWTPFKNSDIQLSADLYHNRIDNMIDTEAVSENTADANAVTTYENIEGTSTFSGVEANLILPLLYGFRLDLTANYLEARDPDDEDLTNRPRSRLNATLSYRFRDKLRANLRYNYRGKYLSDKEPHQRIDPFDYFNAQITYQIFPAVSLFIGGRNLLYDDPPVDVADYEGGHMESMIDSPLGAFYYGGLRLTI
jgi:outer membrane receptor for ferrienterochelin and colicin